MNHNYLSFLIFFLGFQIFDLATTALVPELRKAEHMMHHIGECSNGLTVTMLPSDARPLLSTDTGETGTRPAQTILGLF